MRKSELSLLVVVRDLRARAQRSRSPVRLRPTVMTRQPDVLALRRAEGDHASVPAALAATWDADGDPHRAGPVVRLSEDLAVPYHAELPRRG